MAVNIRFCISKKTIVFCVASLWITGIIILAAASNEVTRNLIAKQFAFMHELNNKLDLSAHLSENFEWFQNDTQENDCKKTVVDVDHDETKLGSPSDKTLTSQIRDILSLLHENSAISSNQIDNLLYNPKNAYANEDSTFSQEDRQRWKNYEESGLERTGELNLTDYFNDLVLVRKVTNVFDLIDNAKYDYFDELKASQQAFDYDDIKSNGQSNQKIQGECLKQLDRFVARASKVLNATENGDIVDDYNMLLLLDSFGQLGAGLSGTLLTWTGDYDSCREVKIRDPNGQVADSATRFCWAGLKPEGAGPDQLIMSGLCLPIACDSSNFGNKFELLLELARLRVPILKRVNLSLDRLYCLPDEKSPLRSMQNSMPTMIFACMIFAWLSFLIYCTIKFRKTSKKSSFYASFAIDNNLRSLFKLQADSDNENDHENQNNNNNNNSNQEDNKKINNKSSDNQIDFSCLGGIKVLCSSYIILGHVMMCLTIIIKEGRSLIREPAVYVLSNQMPAFAVNPFFCITGLLTCYQILQQNKHSKFLYKTGNWLAITVFRYIRIMPIYLLVIAYAKLMAKYTNNGPYWDYATSDKSMRRRCEQESWLATLMFMANFKHPFDHCIPSAWYLANDFQFFLITPILLCLLDWRPRLGRLALKLGTLASFISGFASIYLTSPETDLSPIAKFQPHGFKVYLTHLTNNYTYPQNRVSSYLIGLLLGHELYLYIEKRRSQAQIKPEKNIDEAEDTSESQQKQQHISTNSGSCDIEPEFWWSKYAMKSSLLAISLLWIIPKLGARLPLNAWQSRFLFSFIMPAYHILISFSIGALILTIATGKRRNLLTEILSANFWKPLSRMSLAVVLINIEVINYIIQGQRHSIHFDNHKLIMYLLYSLFSVYLFAIPFTVLFEAPLRNLLNLALKKASISLKQQTTRINQKKQA